MAIKLPVKIKTALVSVLDFLLVYLAVGYVVALLTGQGMDGGSDLSGLPAVAVFAALCLYFLSAKRVGGKLF